MLVRASAIKANSHSRHLVLNDEQALQHPQLPQQRCRTNQESAILPSTKTRQKPHDPTKGELQKQRQFQYFNLLPPERITENLLGFGRC